MSKLGRILEVKQELVEDGVTSQLWEEFKLEHKIKKNFFFLKAKQIKMKLFE